MYTNARHITLPDEMLHRCATCCIAARHATSLRDMLHRCVQTLYYVCISYNIHKWTQNIYPKNWTQSIEHEFVHVTLHINILLPHLCLEIYQLSVCKIQ